MDRIDAINWMEQWADRHGIALAPHRRPGAGGSYIGWVRQPVNGEIISPEALAEAIAMGSQLVFEEFGPPPASSASGSSAADAGGSAGEGERASPLTNRGDRVTSDPFRGFQVVEDQSLFAAVDQFTLVGKGSAKRDAMRATVQRFLGEGQPGLFGHNTYKESWRWECGAELNFTEGREDWCLMVRGRTLQLVGEERHLEFLLAVDAEADHCTRVDPRIDDYSRRVIDLAAVAAASEAGNFTGPRTFEVIRKARNLQGRLRIEGATYAFGTRESTRVIFYDKSLESHGLICSNRLEAGQYKDKAQAAWVKLMEAGRRGQDHFIAAVGQIVCGSIDFRDRGEHRHVERMERLPFWSSIVDRLGSVKLRIEKASSTLNASLWSMIRQYGKKLGRAAVVAEAMGEDLVLQLVHAVDRLREGQELEDRDLSPLEGAFRPRGVFRPIVALVQ